MARAHFDERLFRFLSELADNNDREWFAANKQRYVEQVRDPLLRFIREFEDPLHRVSPHFRADARANGGSMFRIYRDTRFAKDKSPYKTHAAAHFRHEAAKDVNAPGFYLHLEPGGCFMGAGIWHPDGETLGKIRQAIVDAPGEWSKLLRSKALRETFALEGESLKRPPRGFDAEHPLIEDLKRKDFVVVRKLTRREVTAPGFIRTFAASCRQAGPFVRFLTDAIGQKF